MSTNDFITPGGHAGTGPFHPGKTGPTEVPVPSQERRDGPMSLDEVQRLVEQAAATDKAETSADSKSGAGGQQDRRTNDTPVLDPKVVNQTRQQIRSLVDEIVELGRTDCTLEDFLSGFLTKTVTALASPGGAIWMRDTEDGPLQLRYQINLKSTSLAENVDDRTRHHRLLEKLATENTATLVAPQSGSDEKGQPGNPTEYLLVVGPLAIDRKCIGLVEILQRPDAGPTTQRGYLRFLNRMCEIASDHLRDRRLRSFQEQQGMWQQLESFIANVHQGLNLDETVYTIANEGRRLIDCDRVSVAVSQGRRCQIKAVSGLDSIERRADQVKRLGELATRVVRTGKPLWYSGTDDDLPPQIEKYLQAYVDKSHTKMLGILPLMEQTGELEDENRGVTGEPGNKQPQRNRSNALGALIVEQLKDASLPETTRKRIEVVTAHSRTALTNAHNHNSLFLLPVWKVLGKMTSAFRGRALGRTLGILTLFGLLGCFLCLFPYRFSLSATGQLIPEKQHEVFVKVDGILDEILVPADPDGIVEKNSVIGRMSNNDLRAEIEFFEGELRRIDEQLSTLERSKFDNPENKDRIVLAGQYAEAVEEYKIIEHRLRLKLADAAQLEIRSPIRGQVINWQLRQNLIRRPVTRGQNIMTVVDPDEKWVIELEMPERRVTHLMDAREESGDDALSVTFTLASHPGREFEGELISIDKRMDVHTDNGNTLLIRVAFDNSEIPRDLFRSGTRVTANVNCGTASIGYVYFHELIETVHSSFLLWF